jgi:hypothetical protein
MTLHDSIGQLKMKLDVMLVVYINPPPFNKGQVKPEAPKDPWLTLPIGTF